MSSTQLLEFFESRRLAAVPVVLVTVIATAGSTYSKAGHRILIDPDGVYFGLVSGGCLEGDLFEHAKRVFQDGTVREVTYDMRGEEDELWGLGIGCNGLFKLLLQRLDPGDSYHPYSAIASALMGDFPFEIRFVTSSQLDGAPAGTTEVFSFVDDMDTDVDSGADTLLRRSLRALPLQRKVSENVYHHCGHIRGRSVECLVQRLMPLPRILVFGAGLDAVPLVQILRSLGLRVEVADHRKAYLERPEWGSAQRHELPDADSVDNLLAAKPIAAAVVMSHSLRVDERYLHALSRFHCQYIGLLGPKHRRDRLLANLSAREVALLEPRLHGPAGLDIGADSPAAIALSIAAQLYSTLRSASAIEWAPKSGLT